MPRLIAMIDAGFLREAGRATLECPKEEIVVQPEVIRRWCEISATRLDHDFIRAYWYDALYPSSQPEAAPQAVMLDELRTEGGIQLRLGKLVDRPTPWRREVKNALRQIGANVEEFNKAFLPRKSFEQKGVDTLLVLDMVHLSQRGAYDTLLLVTGDEDMAEAVRAVQSDGRRVILATPTGAGKASDLYELADEHVRLGVDTLRHLLQPAPAYPTAADAHHASPEHQAEDV